MVNSIQKKLAAILLCMLLLSSTVSTRPQITVKNNVPKIISHNSIPDQAEKIVWIKDMVNFDSELTVKLPNLGGMLVQTVQSQLEGLNYVDLTPISFQLEKPNLENIDPIFTNSISENNELIGVPRVWNEGVTGNGTVIAVVDTGIDFSHPALVGKMFDQKSFISPSYGYDLSEDETDVFGHGTSVASIISGSDASLPYQGVAYNSKLVNAKIGTSTGYITSAALIGAIDWLMGISEVDIINLSLGEPEEGPSQDVLENIVNLAVKSGKVVVASAGNNGNLGEYVQDPMTIGSPGSDIEAITIGGTTSSGTFWGSSSEGPTTNWEPKPDLMAPGLNIQVARIASDYSSCTINLCYRSNTGTSFATPFVSGVAALLIQQIKNLDLVPNPGIVKSVLSQSASDKGYEWFMQGNGLINASNAYEYLNGMNPMSHAFPTKIPYFAQEKIPKTINRHFPISVVSDRIESWSIDNIDGNVSSIITIDPSKSDLGYSQIIWVDVKSDATTLSGNYSGTITLQSPNGDHFAILIQFELIDEPSLKVLLDLAHTPWDSILSNRRTRVERIIGEDIRPILNMLLDRNIWVEEFIDEYLTYDILNEYDLLWMPSAFTRTIPAYFDHTIPRETSLYPEELFAIYQFKLNGGRILFDFGGYSELDDNFDYTIPDSDSIESFLSLFGSVPGIITNLPEENTEFMLNSSQLYDPILESQVGSTTISNGLPFFGVGEETYISGFIGSQSSRSLLINTRNWRDESAMSKSIYQQTASVLLDWLFSDDFITSLEYSYHGSSTIFTGTLKNPVSGFNVVGIDESWDIKIQNLQVLESGSFAFTIPDKNSGSLSLLFSNDEYWFKYEVELDSDFPQILIHDAILYDDGLIEISFSISDNNDVPALNFKTTLNPNIEHGDLNKHKNTYSFYLNSSEVTQDLDFQVEVLDLHGNYASQSKHIDSYSDPPKKEGSNVVLIVTLLVLVILLGYIIRSKKYQKIKT